jgi:hypothetical protein
MSVAILVLLYIISISIHLKWIGFFSSNLIALKLISTDVISLFNVSVNRGLYCIILRMDVLTLLESD